jgi:L-alanine-DL-glutamate epimerase-like enolase superfamily enzyme
MRIESVQSRLYRIPPTVRWEDSTHHVTALEYVVTEITTDIGIVGTGISYTTGVGGSAIVALVDDYCAAMLLGESPFASGRVWSFLEKQLRRNGSGLVHLALAAVDTALWDIVGKAVGQPLHQLLGACHERVPVYGSGIDLFFEQDALLDHVETMLADGFEWIKIKVGRDDPEEDAARVRAVRKLLGRGRRLCVDANQAWTVADARRRVPTLEAAGADLAWLEEPLHPDDVRGHADLRRSTFLPIAVGESIYSEVQFLRYLEADAVDVVQPDVCRVGGFTGLMRVAELASVFHRHVAPHYVAELTVGALCAIPNALVLEWVRGGTLSELGAIRRPLRIDDGFAYPYEQPGHGLDIDFDALQPYQVDSETLKQTDTRAAK